MIVLLLRFLQNSCWESDQGGVHNDAILASAIDLRLGL